MKKEIIFVSKIHSKELYKSPKAHIDNNPLIMSRFNPRSGKRIGTSIGNNLSNLVSKDHADYYYIVDLSIHDHEKLDPADITAFLLAYSDKVLNKSRYSNKADDVDIALILFDFIMDGMSMGELENRKIPNFFNV